MLSIKNFDDDSTEFCEQIFRTHLQSILWWIMLPNWRVSFTIWQWKKCYRVWPSVHPGISIQCRLIQINQKSWECCFFHTAPQRFMFILGDKHEITHLHNYPNAKPGIPCKTYMNVIIVQLSSRVQLVKLNHNHITKTGDMWCHITPIHTQLLIWNSSCLTLRLQTCGLCLTQKQNGNIHWRYLSEGLAQSAWSKQSVEKVIIT